MITNSDPVREFETNYDETIVKVCRPYLRFLDLGSMIVPEGLESLCELGIGTGNFSALVHKRHPEIRITGIDLNPKYTAKALDKIKDLTLVHADVFTMELPQSDFYVSSLTMHHLKSPSQQTKLLDIARHAREGFVNFDLYLPEDRDENKILEEVMKYASSNFEREDLPVIRGKILENDHPITLKEHEKAFTDNGFSFRVLKNEFPFVVYLVKKE